MVGLSPSELWGTLLGVMAVCLGSSAWSGEPSDSKTPVPSASARESELAAIRAELAQQYLSAATTEEKAAVCRGLINNARQTANDPARRFVLLDVARKAAIQIGEVATALEAVDVLAAEYDVDDAALKAVTLQASAQNATSETQQQAVAACALALLEGAASLDRHGQAIYEVARTAVRTTRDPQLIRRLQACRLAIEKEPSGDGRDSRQLPPPRIPALENYAKPWRIRLPRKTMLAAWERHKAVEIPGVDIDQRFQIADSEYHVSPSGDDSDDGSREHPWRTLAHAVSQLKPAMVVYLHAGTYYGPVTIDTRGTKDAPAALRAAQGESVYVTYPEDWIAARAAEVYRAPKEGREQALDAEGKELHYAPLIGCRGTYVEISGLHLIGVRDLLPHNLYSENGISFFGGGGEGCRALYNEIEGCGHCGVKEMGHGGHSILIEGNYMHDIGQTFHDHCIYAPADDVIVRKNLLLNAVGYGLQAYTKPKRMIATHNIMAGNDQHGMVQAGPDAVIAHNVFGSNQDGGVFFFRDGCTGMVVKNNLFFDRNAVAFDECGDQKRTPSGNTFDYNCLAPGVQLGRTSPLDSVGIHNFQADPMVMDMVNLDFRLRRGSPCVDAGAPAEGNYYGRAPDVGIYETGAR